MRRTHDPRVYQVQEKHWPCLRDKQAALDKYFSEAAQKGQPQRASKRQRTSSTMTKDYDEVEISSAGAGKQYRALMAAAAASDKTVKGADYYDSELVDRRDELA